MNRKSGTPKHESSRSENDVVDFYYEPKLMCCKIKRNSQPDFDSIWPITPIKNEQRFDSFSFFNQELPEESDDEEYRPGPEDLLDQSEDETGRHSVVSTISQTSTLDISANQYLESFDSNLLVDDAANQPDDNLFKVPEENIGQRTRSKLCLSDTPLETIEKEFIPPDITTDMYDFKCDNEDWENFLKEFMQPLSNETNDPEDDDKADPDYNISADEEEVDKEELRCDRGVVISRKERRKLISELFDNPEDYSSDEEEEKKVRNEITDRVNLDFRKKGIKVSSKDVDSDDGRTTVVSKSQRLLIEQQLRQHVQLSTQNFLQTCEHPMFSAYAGTCKVILADLLELAKMNENSIFDVYNLKPAFALVQKWEKHLMSNAGKEVISHMKKEMIASKKAKKERNFYRIAFHPSLLKTMSESEVFMYPLLLPPLGFRCDGPFKVHFVAPEDALLALGLDEFTEYLSNFGTSNGSKQDEKCKSTLKAVVKLLCEYLLVAKKPSQVQRHIRNVMSIKTNPVYYYYKNNRAPDTIHYVVPFNDNLKRPPKNYSSFFLPKNFQEFLSETAVKQELKDNG